MTKTVAIAQARIGSTRLPRKVLLPILDKPMLWHQINRMSHSKSVDVVAVATANNVENQDIVDFSKGSGIQVFAGDECDLISRFLGVAELTSADIIVRITADCPLIDPQLIDRAVEGFIKQDKYQFMSSYGFNGLPLGMDVEIFSVKLLRQLDYEISDKFRREWFTTNVFDNKEKYGYGVLDIREGNDYSNLRLTVDYPKDFELIKYIFEYFNNVDRCFGIDDIIELYHRNNDLFDINIEHQYEDQAAGINKALSEYREENDR